MSDLPAMSNGYPVAGKCKNCGQLLTLSEHTYATTPTRIPVHVHNYRHQCGAKNAELADPHEGYPPPNGWMPEDFPQLSIDHIPYTTNPLIRPDPIMHITPQGWLFIEAGGHRIAIPDEEEWVKLKRIGDCTWNDYKRALSSASQGQENPHDADLVDPDRPGPASTVGEPSARGLGEGSPSPQA